MRNIVISEYIFYYKWRIFHYEIRSFGSEFFWKSWKFEQNLLSEYCVKSVHIWSYSGLHFSCIFPHSDWIRRDTEYLSIFSPNAEKMRTKITPNTDTFYEVRSSRWNFSTKIGLLQNSCSTKYQVESMFKILEKCLTRSLIRLKSIICNFTINWTPSKVFFNYFSVYVV